MLSPGYTTTDEILERVRRDYGFEDVLKDEVKEWLWDFIGIIEIQDAFIDKLIDVTITNYRGILPDDIIGIYNGGVRQKNTAVPLVHMGDIWYQDPNPVAQLTAYEQELFANEHTYYAESTTTYPPFSDPTTMHNVAPTVTTTEDTTEEYGFQIPQPRFNPEDQYTYKIKGNCIYTGLKEDTIQIAYQAFPINEDGTPAIPNDPKVIRAAQLWVASKIALRLKLKDEISKANYDMIDQELAFAIPSAQNKAKMPSIDQMEAIAKRWMRLIPDLDEHRSGFRYIQNQERLRSM
jgi:hypothetical protein